MAREPRVHFKTPDWVVAEALDSVIRILKLADVFNRKL